MVDWFLNPALTRFRNEVNARYPKRDKASDGTIGDAAHQASTSDHNPDVDGSVDAWDMDNNLTPNKTESDRIIYSVLIPAFQKHEASQYWIYQGKIASRSDGWKVRPYNGSNRHDKHVHWNTRTAFEKSKKPWLPKEENVAITEADVAAIAGGIAKVLNVRFGFPVGPVSGPAPVDWQEVANAVKTPQPTTVELSDAQLDVLADKVITALQSGEFVFRKDSDA